MMANKVIKPVLLGNAARNAIRYYSIESRVLQVPYSEKPKPAPPFTVQFKYDPLFGERLDTLYLDKTSNNPVILRTVANLTEDRDSSLIDLQYGSRETRVPEASSLSPFSHTILEFSTNLKQSLDAHESSDEEPKKQQPAGAPDLDGKPSLDQLQKVYNIIQKTLPKLFTHSIDYSIYRKDVLVVDNIRGKVFTGVGPLVRELSYLRLYGHFKYAYVTLELVSMHQVPNEGRITVRWRIKGISGLRTMLKFWQYKLWEWRKVMSSYEVWNDGIAHFDVGADGQVYKVTVDKMEEERNIEKASTLDRLIKLKQKAVA